MAQLPDIELGAVEKEDTQKQLEAVVKQVNDHAREVSNEHRTKIVRDDSGTPRLLEGFQLGGFSNGDVGIKLSQPGQDVTTATDNQLIWSSDFNMFKIVDSGTTEVIYSFPEHTAPSSGSEGSGTTTIVHDLGYVPGIVAFMDSGSAYTPISSGSVLEASVASSASVFRVFNIAVDSTYLYFSVARSFSAVTDTVIAQSGTINIKYYLVRETAN